MTKSSWISIKEKEPEDMQLCFAAHLEKYENGRWKYRVLAGWYKKNRKELQYDNDRISKVDYWMPRHIPLPPKLTKEELKESRAREKKYRDEEIKQKRDELRELLSKDPK